MTQRWLLHEGTRVPIADGDTLLSALLRAGIHPGGGGCLCAAGDCPNCLAVVDGVAYTRTCQTLARPGLVVTSMDLHDPPPTGGDVPAVSLTTRTDRTDVVVIGAGSSGRAEAERLQAAGRVVLVIDGTPDGDAEEAVGIYPGPMVVSRRQSGVRRVLAEEVVVATGARETQPACLGNDLIGIVTPRAAALLRSQGVDLGRVVAVGPLAQDTSDATAVPGSLVRFEPRAGSPRLVGAVVVAEESGEESRHECDSVVVALGPQPRDALARMGNGLGARAIGGAASPPTPQPVPTEGIVCRCSAVSVADLYAAWQRGFDEMELLKRATLFGTGTCQGMACAPHVSAWIDARRSAPAVDGEPGPGRAEAVRAKPFTARPLARQMTMAEAAAGYDLPPTRRTALHDVHVALGARMERSGGWWRPWSYGAPEREYWSVREGVSLGDVSTLGKIEVSGPDAADFLDRIYPVPVSGLRVGRSRYVLLLDEGGYVMDDGMVSRRSPTRFSLSFTSAGGGRAEMWLRDWADGMGADVRIMDRTMALGAINVTGPAAAELMDRAGMEQPLSFMDWGPRTIAGIDCDVFRLSFTGETSFEIHHRADNSVALWHELWALGSDLGVFVHGLDTLFTLRLEKGHILVGQDTDLDGTPDRIAHGWAVKMGDDRDFIGKAALQRLEDRPPSTRLIGFEVAGELPSFEGDTIWAADRNVGYTTSMRYSPVLGRTVGLAQVEVEPTGAPPARMTVADRPLTVRRPPFYDPEGARARA